MMMRLVDSQQVQPSRSHQHRHHQRHQQQQQQKHSQNEQTCSNSMGDNATRRSSARRSKHHHTCSHNHQQHQPDNLRSQRPSHRRRHQSGAGGDNDNHDKNHMDASEANEDVNTAFSVAEDEDERTGLGDASASLAPHSTLIDQMLIFCAKNAHQQPPTSATAAVACNSRRRKSQSHSQDQQPQSNGVIQLQGLSGVTSNSRSASQCQEDSTEAILGGGGFTGAKAETAAGKGLTRQWEVSKQFVLANCFNCLSQRMRDLQQTEEPSLATQKLTVLSQLRRLTGSVRRIDLTKQLYSAGKRSKQVLGAVGLRHGALSADLLHKWSSRENEYQLYWMALLEKTAASLTNCQDIGVLQQQLEFAQDLVDVQGFPLS